MIAAFGDEYRAYMRRTARVVPWVYIDATNAHVAILLQVAQVCGASNLGGIFAREIWQCDMDCLKCKMRLAIPAIWNAGYAASREEVMRGWWRFIAAIGVLAAGMMLVLGANPGMAQSRAHVYLLRGLMNIFSLGMDTLGAELSKRGVYATVDNHADWQSLADQAAAHYKAGSEGPIIIIGHSLGADAVMEMADYLGHEGRAGGARRAVRRHAIVGGRRQVRRVLNLTQRDYAYMRRGPGLPRLARQCRCEFRSEHRPSQYRQVAAAACPGDQRSSRHRRRTPRAGPGEREPDQAVNSDARRARHRGARRRRCRQACSGSGRTCGAGQVRQWRHESPGMLKPVAESGGTPVIALPERVAAQAGYGGTTAEAARAPLAQVRIELRAYCRCRRRRFDGRAIAASLQHAVLILLNLGDGVGDPDAGADEQGDDRKRDDIHQHALTIVDRLFLVLVRIARGRRLARSLVAGLCRRAKSRAASGDAGTAAPVRIHRRCASLVGCEPPANPL